MKMSTRRPVFFNLAQIQMPVGALTSITHRITGIFLAAGVPVAIYILDLSLQSTQTYMKAVDLFDEWYFKVFAIIFIWALAHHLLAGVRHLLSDIDVGSLLPAGRRSAWIVNSAGLAVALVAAKILI